MLGTTVHRVSYVQSFISVFVSWFYRRLTKHDVIDWIWHNDDDIYCNYILINRVKHPIGHLIITGAKHVSFYFNNLLYTLILLFIIVLLYTCNIYIRVVYRPIFHRIGFMIHLMIDFKIMKDKLFTLSNYRYLRRIPSLLRSKTVRHFDTAILRGNYFALKALSN